MRTRRHIGEGCRNEEDRKEETGKKTAKKAGKKAAKKVGKKKSASHAAGREKAVRARVIRTPGSRSSGSMPVRPHLSMVTSVMPLTRLLASRKLPSRVTDVLRTMLPPPGIAQLWNVSVFGSKRTTVFGVDPDSLYQITSLIADMP